MSNKIYSFRPQIKDVLNLRINEVTLRESIQAVNPLISRRAIVFTPQDRFEIARLLMEFGVEQIEIGAPHDSFILDNTKQLVKMAQNSKKTLIAIHCRCHPDDVVAFLSTGAKIINLYIGTSEENRLGNGGRTRDDVINYAKHTIQKIREKKKDVFIRFSAEDTFRTNEKDLLTIIDSISSMVDVIGLPDTVGIAYPDEVFKMISKFRRRLNHRLKLEFHGHNDRGNAIINALAALRAGAHIIDTAILGYGERNGITSLNGLISELITPEVLPFLEKKYNLKKLIHLIKTFSRIIGVPISHDQPIVSPGAVCHVAGVHTKAVDVNNRAYLSFDPIIFGLENDQYSLVASSAVGGNSIQKWAQSFGISLTIQQAKEVANRVRIHAFTRGLITEKHVKSIIFSYNKELIPM